MRKDEKKELLNVLAVFTLIIIAAIPAIGIFLTPALDNYSNGTYLSNGFCTLTVFCWFLLVIEVLAIIITALILALTRLFPNVNY